MLIAIVATHLMMSAALTLLHYHYLCLWLACQEFTIDFAAKELIKKQTPPTELYSLEFICRRTAIK
jgi:hypothetical protein